MTERSRLLNRIEDDEIPQHGIISRNQTRLCIIVTVLMFVFLITTVALAAVLGYTKLNEDDNNDNGHKNHVSLLNMTYATALNTSLCLTMDCIRATARLSEYMDESVNPCTDFYQYSCGGWEKINSIPDGLGRWGTFEQLAKDNYGHLIGYLSKKSVSNDAEAIKKMRQIYVACLDTEKIKEDTPEALKHYLTITGGWDETNVTQKEPWSINSSLVVEHYYGSSAFFEFDIESDDFNSSLNVIKIGQAGLTLGIPEFYRNRSGDEFVGLIKHIAKTLTPIVNEDPHLIARDIANFERELSFSFLTDTELRNVSALYNPMSLENFTDIFPDIDWVNYFNTIFDKTFGDETHHAFTEDDLVIVETVSYFQNLSLLLEQFGTETVRNYAKWQLILNSIQYTDNDGFAIRDILRKSRFPKSSRLGDERSTDCAEFVENAMPYALARPFVDEFISDDLRTKVNNTANAIEKAFIDRIKQKDWLDNTTKDRCIEKVHAITRQIAYPDFIKDNKTLDKFYEDLQFTNADFISIGYDIMSFQFKQMLSQYGKPVDKTQWLNAPTEVNAYYAPQFNQFVFLAGILRSPFIVADWPSSILFGAMGVVIGHELTHGFDDQGQQYDKNGNRVNWWNESSIVAFKNRTQCFVDQYNQYEQQGVKINGQLTLGENIADNGGIHTAYLAYQQNRGKQDLYSELSQDKLFFISFGQVWCSLLTPEYLESSTRTDPHSPGPIRVNGSIQNSEEFTKAFNCKTAPAKRCELW